MRNNKQIYYDLDFIKENVNLTRLHLLINNNKIESIENEVFKNLNHLSDLRLSFIGDFVFNRNTFAYCIVQI
jgi:hypothetical protein